MAERDAIQKRYAYQEMSNKVEQADRSLLRSVRSEPTGEVESLRGRKDIGRMGDRVIATSTNKISMNRPVELEEKMEKAKKRRKTQEDKEKLGLTSTRKHQQHRDTVLVGQTILDVNLTGYQPTNPTSRAAYESFLVGLLDAMSVCECVCLFCFGFLTYTYFHSCFFILAE